VFAPLRVGTVTNNAIVLVRVPFKDKVLKCRCEVKKSKGKINNTTLKALVRH